MHQGCLDHRGLAHSRRVSPALRIDRDRQAVAGRCRHARQDQSRRVRDGLVEHHELLRPGREPVAKAWRQPAAGGGRLVRRLCGGGGGARRVRRDRHRYRRLDPPAGELLRHCRAEAHLWPLLALGRGRLRLVARPARADDPHRARRGDHAWRDGRARPARLDLGAAAGAGLRGGADRRYPRPQGRHPTRIPRPRHAGRDRGVVARGRRLAARRRRRAHRDQPAAHQIRAGDLLHHRPGRGVLEPRAL